LVVVSVGLQASALKADGDAATKPGLKGVDLSVSEQVLHVRIRGLDKLRAWKGHFDIPVAHVRSVRMDPAFAARPRGIRVPGVRIRGVLTAGTFLKEGKRSFWLVRHPEKAIVIDLVDERYDQLVLEVDEPSDALVLLETAIGKPVRI